MASPEVNAQTGCCWVPGTSRPLAPSHPREKRLAPPSRPAQTDPNFPGSGPAIRRAGGRRGLARSPALPESWVARAGFPPLPFRTQTGMYLGQPGRGRTCQARRGERVAMTASFRFLAFPSSLTALPPGGTAARAEGRAGKSGSFHRRVTPPRLRTARRFPQALPPQIPGSPRHSPRGRWGPAPGKEHWNSPPTPQFLVFLSGDKRRGCEPIAAQDAPPAARAAPSALRGHISRTEKVPSPPQTPRLSARAAGGAARGPLPRPSLRLFALPQRREERGAPPTRIFPDALAEDASGRSGGSRTSAAPSLRALCIISPAPAVKAAGLHLPEARPAPHPRPAKTPHLQVEGKQ